MEMLLDNRRVDHFVLDFRVFEDVLEILADYVWKGPPQESSATVLEAL